MPIKLVEYDMRRFYLVRSGGGCRQSESALKVGKPNETKFRQLDGVAESVFPFNKGASGASFCSRSASNSDTPATGIAADGESLRLSKARAWTSSEVCSFSSWSSRLPVSRWLRDRTTSPLQMGQVRRRVVNQGVMHSAWNSCPHGRLMTLLWPSMYSSRHTTHSTCLPVYFRRHKEEPEFCFSMLVKGVPFAEPSPGLTIPDVV